MLAGVTISSVAVAQTKLIEKVTKSGDEVVIPYEKYQMDNGLTLVIHEDHSDPIVKVDVTYHVGSAREEVGKSGFAHFFEHMMFQGTDHVADEEHFKIVTEAGGTLNGTTNNDRTNYFETLPSNQLETALWLEADRMGYLLDAVTQEKFEVQRETVKNERGQRVDNAPYGRIFEMLGKNLYPYGHPYSWPTIGYLEDLNSVDVNDLKNFFLRWYGPNNAVITIGGDVNPQEVIKLVEKYFGNIPRGPEVTNMVKMPAKLDKDRYVHYVDNNIRFPALLLSYPTVEENHPDAAALGCLAEIIGQGKNSFFYKRFVKTQKAIQSSIFNNNSELSGEIIMFVLPFPGQSLSDFENEIKEALVDFEKSGITQEAIDRFKAQYEANTINGLASVDGKVAQLANYQTFTGNPNYIKKELEAYRALTMADVKRVYEAYIKNKPAVILSVVPEGQEGIVAKASNYEIQKKAEGLRKVDYDGLTYNKPKDNFDRSQRPASGPNPVVKVPEYFTKTLKNGLTIIGTQMTETPTTALQVRIEGGHRAEASMADKAGVASLMAAMMNEGTKNFSVEELSNALDLLGSSVSVGSSSSEVVVYVQTLTKNLDATLKIVEEVMLRPAFADEDFDRLKKQQIENISAGAKQPSAIADKVFGKLLYGSDIYATPSEGTVETVTNITLDDVKSFYAKYFSPKMATAVIVSSAPEKNVMAKLSFLNSWNGEKAELASLSKIELPAKTKVYLVDKPNAPQSEIRIGYLTDLPYDATGEYFKTNLMNYTMGGMFNSRINLNLREDKGYTYGARSGFSSGSLPGPFQASAGVRADATAESVIEFMREMTTFRTQGITNDEVAFLKKSIGQRDALKYETPSQKAGFLNQIVKYDLDKNFVKNQQKILASISKREIDELARKYVKTDNMYIVVVGDAASNKEKLTDLGYELVMVDTNGEIIN
ncbi:MAG: zinc protease [Sphingobacteriales bacterium]